MADDYEWLSDYIVNALKSPTWVAPIAQFVDERCGIFDDVEENRLEYMSCHQEFKILIDDLFLAHLIDVSVTQAQFEDFCQRGLQNKALHHILMEQLLSVEDFLTFKAMMVKRNAELDQKAALELLPQDMGSAAAAAQEEPVASGDWGMYDEELERALKDSAADQAAAEEQLEQALKASELAHAEEERRRAAELTTTLEMVKEAERRGEQADLERAIALSLQAEEERINQAAVSSDAAAQGVLPAEAASVPAMAPVNAVDLLPPHSPLNNLPPAGAAPAFATTEEVRKGIPRVVKLQPLVSAPQPMPPEPPPATVALGQMRERAERAVVAAAPPAEPAAAVAAAPSAAVGPTDEERRERAEHLKRQRNLIIQKRNQEREQQLRAYAEAKGQTAATTSAAAVNPNFGVDAGLVPGTGAVQQADAESAASAQRMRQALTLQLRQTLTSVTASDTRSLNEKVSQLESMKAGQ